jgi:hypothetical protein
MRLFIILLLTITGFGKAQAQAPAYDSIDFKKIRVNGLFFGSKKAELEKRFGNPQKVVTTEAVKGTDLYSDYHYGKSTMRVSPAGVFNGFKLTEDNFVLGYGLRLIKAGASLKEFAIYFPASFKSYANDKSGKFKLKIRPGNAFIVFKTKEGVVTEIETWEETL